MEVHRMFIRQIAFALLLLSSILPREAWGISVDSFVATQGPSSLTVTAALSRDSQSPPGTLTLTAGDRDFLVPSGSVRGEYVADIEFLSGSGSITLSGYVDTTNTPFGTQILIGTTTEGSVPFVASPVPFTLGGPYALTLVAVITLAPDSSVTFTHTVSVTPDAASVPEPETALLLGSALLLLALSARPLSTRLMRS